VFDRITRFLRPARLLNLGCGGSFHSAWENYDLAPASPEVRPIDLSEPLPFEDAVYDAVYSSHVLEHIDRSRAPALLGEMFRVLKPGGVIRVVVPDLEVVTREYLRQLDAAATGSPQALARHEWTTLELLDQLTRSFSGGFMGRLWASRPLPARDYIVEHLGLEASVWLERFDADFAAGKYQPIPPEAVYLAPPVEAEAEIAFRRTGENHRWMYDRVSLGRLLRATGFERPTVRAATDSAIPRFAGYGLDSEPSGRVRKARSLFMEAVRPITTS